jgi:hypothetical protein
MLTSTFDRRLANGLWVTPLLDRCKVDASPSRSGHGETRALERGPGDGTAEKGKQASWALP